MLAANDGKGAADHEAPLVAGWWNALRHGVAATLPSDAKSRQTKPLPSATSATKSAISGHFLERG
jgi:hypothetical protein